MFYVIFCIHPININGNNEKPFQCFLHLLYKILQTLLKESEVNKFCYIFEILLSTLAALCSPCNIPMGQDSREGSKGMWD